MSYSDAVAASRGRIHDWQTIDVKFSALYPLFEKYFCVSASSAAVERVFVHGGLLIRPRRAKLGDKFQICVVLYNFYPRDAMLC